MLHKELDRSFGLDTYDVHARNYFPMLPMWDRMDPLAETYYGISPYVYCVGNPVRFINPDFPSNYSYGVTRLPNAENDPSPDGNVYIFTASFLDKSKQVKNTAHEGYGHAYFYELSRKDSSINPSHTKEIVGYYEDEFQGKMYRMPVWGQSNKLLEQQIQIVEKEAIFNYENF